MLPMTVLRRFDCVLAPTKEKVVVEAERLKHNANITGNALEARLNQIAGQRFHNHSPLDFERLKADPDNINQHLTGYINGFSKNVREIFDRFEFEAEIAKMHEANILYLVVSKFCDIDLHPTAVDNIDMGLLFEDLIRRFNEAANETAGDYFTPREVIRLMVDILFDPDDDILTKPGIIRKLLDPACGTGGMLSESQNYLRDNHPQAQLWVFGQDFNPRAYSIAASDLIMKGSENSDIRFGDSLIDDKYPHDDPITHGKFDYLLANPPFGVDWKKQQKDIMREREKFGDRGRFGAGLPRVNDGSLLFLQHMISKFEPYEPKQLKYGSRLAIVFNGSPLFTGGAGSGESEIRRWIIENDWLEAIIALPEQMFYNTGISTYIWIVTNRKASDRKGTIQLIDARDRWKPMRRSLGDKRRYLGEDDIATVVGEYGDLAQTETSRVFGNEEFGFRRVPIERPLRLIYQMTLERKSRFLDARPHLLYDIQIIDQQLGRERHPDWNHVDAQITKLIAERGGRWKATERKLFRDVFTDRSSDGRPVVLNERKLTSDPEARVWGWFPDSVARVERMYEADAQLRDFENIPLADEVHTYFCREVEPQLPDAWADREAIRPSYEINFNRHFYRYTPPRSLAEIDADLRRNEEEILRLLREVTS